MTLNEYLYLIGLKKYKFAEKSGISGRTITRICKGKKVSIFISRLVEFFTDGNVKAKDICNDSELIQEQDDHER